jgi:hypothetical protein
VHQQQKIEPLIASLASHAKHVQANARERYLDVRLGDQRDLDTLTGAPFAFGQFVNKIGGILRSGRLESVYEVNYIYGCQHGTQYTLNLPRAARNDVALVMRKNMKFSALYS